MRKPLTHDRRIVLLAAAAALPAVAVSLGILWAGDYSSKVRWTLTVFVVFAWLAFVQALRERVIRPLQTVSNILAAMREEDFSIRARGARPDDALGEVLVEVNALAETLREQRLGALEATALLSRVMAEIEVAVFAFDDAGLLRLVNRFGETPPRRNPSRACAGAGPPSSASPPFSSPTPPRILEATFPGGAGRWEIRQSAFRLEGAPHTLLVLADVSRPLREEERQAWQRLIRVLGHELNNSLAPIQSIAGSLQRLAADEHPPADWREDLRRGLTVIASRAEALSRFTTAYTRLARLPPPRLAPVALEPLAAPRGRARDAPRRRRSSPGPALVVSADADQLEQLLINLVRNAVDAALETQGGVAIGWKRAAGSAEIWVDDDGPGMPNTSNLFVPFFTTKPGGSGIGLVLSRQIAEAHGGTLTLENRHGHRGCVARLRLPA